jgi:hypothetical protein
MVFTPEACSRFGSSDCANLPQAPRARGSDLLPPLLSQDDVQRIGRPRERFRIAATARRHPGLLTTVVTAAVIVAAVTSLY